MKFAGKVALVTGAARGIGATRENLRRAGKQAIDEDAHQVKPAGGRP